MSTEILRVKNISVGVWDTRNYYTCEITIGGKGAKDEGQERQEKCTFHSTLPQAMMRASERLVRGVETTNLKAWAEAVKKVGEEMEAKITAAAKRLEKVHPKLTRD